MWLYPLPCLAALVGWAFVLMGAATLLVGAVVFLVRAKQAREWPFHRGL